MDKNCEKIDQCDISLVEYYEIANKILYSLLGAMAQRITSDQDKLSIIVSEIMLADWKWNGLGSVYGYRKQRVQWALGKLFRFKREVVSLFQDINEDIALIDTIPDNKINHVKTIEHNDALNLTMKTLDSAELTETEKNCINKYYLAGSKKTMQQVGEELGISKQGVDFGIKKGIKKIRRCIKTNSVGV